MPEGLSEGLLLMQVEISTFYEVICYVSIALTGVHNLNLEWNLAFDDVWNMFTISKHQIMKSYFIYGRFIVH